jgi:protein associated with RNAse G/E
MQRSKQDLRWQLLALYRFFIRLFAPEMIMRKIEVISRKYDGTLRDTYQSDLYAETDESVTLFSLPGNAFWHPRKSAWLKAPDGLIEIYFKHKWYNVWHICEQVSGINRIYVNIAMPVTFRRSKLEWIDLDLDYRLHLDDSIEQLDQAEFEQNVQHMNYPASLIEQIQLACQEVETGLASQSYPFDHQQQVKLYDQIKTTLLTEQAKK